LNRLKSTGERESIHGNYESMAKQITRALDIKKPGHLPQTNVSHFLMYCARRAL
jgi:hypothetical protein